MRSLSISSLCCVYISVSFGVASVRGETVKIQMAEQVVSSCLDSLGLAEPDAAIAHASMVTVEDDNTPFLCDEVNGRALWQVVIQNWLPQTRSTTIGKTDGEKRTWEVLVDPTTGIVLKLKSRWPGSVPSMPPTARADIAVEQMTNAGREKYHGFPSHAPRVPFLQALNAIEARGFAMADAKQVVADYVLWSTMGRQPKAVWAVTYRGVPPLRRYPGSTPGFQDQFRHIVDAESGEWIEGSNTPRPTPVKSVP